MKKIWCATIVALSVLAILAGCTPQTTPTPTIPSTLAPITAPTSNSSPPTSQSPTSQNAWDKIVAAAKKEG
ncbi:MAG: hypothetical protein AAB037_03275, partial [Chloroflexota bacterium]